MLTDAAIADNLARVRDAIAVACARVGRAPDGVRLVAVSKRQPAAAIAAAHRAGQRDFGENYVQELADKQQALASLSDLRLRLIGHLQRNKVGRIVELGCAVDTVDGEKLARALDRRAGEAGRQLEVLLQVNIGREPQKAGIAPEAVAGLVELARSLSHLSLRGLMTVPPAADDPEASRPHFAALRELAREHGLQELSMGMSADMSVAIEEGATMVRVGTAIFGARDR